MKLPRIRSLGTHNTLDGRAPGTAFADVIVFTEAIGHKLRKQLAKTHEVFQCERQKDLCIAIVRRIASRIENLKEHFRLIHPGIAKVTPHRGIYWLTFILDGVKHVIFCEHRINAAFAPWKRGEKFFRSQAWKSHTRTITRKIKRWIKKGYAILGGGDTNTRRQDDAYPVKGYERGRVLDRLFAHGYRLGPTRVMSKMGSDHHRVRVSVRPDFALAA